LVEGRPQGGDDGFLFRTVGQQFVEGEQRGREVRYGGFAKFGAEDGERAGECHGLFCLVGTVLLSATNVIGFFGLYTETWTDPVRRTKATWTDPVRRTKSGQSQARAAPLPGGPCSINTSFSGRWAGAFNPRPHPPLLPYFFIKIIFRVALSVAVVRR